MLQACLKHMLQTCLAHMLLSFPYLPEEPEPE